MLYGDPKNLLIAKDIAKIVSESGKVAAESDSKVSQSLSSRYSNFKPVQSAAQHITEQQPAKTVLQEALTPKQKKIASVAGDRFKIDAADFKALRAGKKVKEELEPVGNELEEGRGRPRKDGSSAEDDGAEADQHIHVQLKKAADAAADEGKGKKASDSYKTKGGADVKFDNGSHFVQAEHAKKVLDALERVKPADREKLHAHIKQSHANFMAVHKLVS